MTKTTITGILSLAVALMMGTALVAGPADKEADMKKPVQVFVLLGQSNMLGFGKVKGGEGSVENAVKNKKLYPYLVDKDGNWVERKDVRNVRIMHSRGSMKTFNNEWMKIGKGNVGVEYGIGKYVGDALDEPVLILKSCIGNRSLGWDLLPPGTPRYKAAGIECPGYGEHCHPTG
jgi:hypothetical protein